jgi:hypothetical protein
LSLSDEAQRQTGLEHLQRGLCAGVLGRIKHIRSMMAARAVHKGSLFDVASALVRGLKAKEGVLSTDAWRAFPNATTLRFYIRRSKVMGRRQFTANIMDTCQTLPQRVTAIRVDRAVTSERSNIRPSSHTLAQAITTAPCYNSIQSLDLRLHVTIKSAEALVDRLPQLQDLRLAVCSDKHADVSPLGGRTARRKASQRLPGERPLPLLQHPSPPYQIWRPSGSGFAKLHSLRISTTQDLALDVSGLAAAADCLTSLAFRTAAITSWACLSSLRQLQQLRLYVPHWQEPAPPLEAAPLDLAWLAGLDQLRELALLQSEYWREGEGVLDRAAWAQLCALPQLEAVQLGCCLTIGAIPKGTSAPRLTRLAAKGLALAEDVSEEQVAGLLAQQAPGLLELALTAWHTRPAELQLAGQLLQGHEALQCVKMGTVWPEGEEELAQWHEQSAQQKQASVCALLGGVRVEGIGEELKELAWSEDEEEGCSEGEEGGSSESDDGGV